MDASVDTATSGVATVQGNTESGVSAMTAVAMAREGRTMAATANKAMVKTAGAMVGTVAARAAKKNSARSFHPEARGIRSIAKVAIDTAAAAVVGTAAAAATRGASIQVPLST